MVKRAVQQQLSQKASTEHMWPQQNQSCVQANTVHKASCPVNARLNVARGPRWVPSSPFAHNPLAGPSCAHISSFSFDYSPLGFCALDDPDLASAPLEDVLEARGLASTSCAPDPAPSRAFSVRLGC